MAGSTKPRTPLVDAEIAGWRKAIRVVHAFAGWARLERRKQADPTRRAFFDGQVQFSKALAKALTGSARVETGALDHELDQALAALPTPRSFLAEPEATPISHHPVPAAAYPATYLDTGWQDDDTQPSVVGSARDAGAAPHAGRRSRR